MNNAITKVISLSQPAIGPLPDWMILLSQASKKQGTAEIVTISNLQIDQLVNKRVCCVRHIGFSGTEEQHTVKVLSSSGFQEGSHHTLRSLTGLPLHDDMGFLSQ